MKDNGPLLQAAMNLRGSAPVEWEMFLKAMREYATADAMNLVTSTPELLLRSQGIAFATGALATLLENAPSELARLKGKTK